MPEKRNRTKAKSARRPNAPLRPRLARPAGDETTAYTARDLERLVNLPRELIRTLTRAGHIHPSKTDNTVSYSFQDLLVLRAASALRAAKIPSRKITDALSKIRDALPPGARLELSVVPAHKDVAIRKGSDVWESSSGQYALPLTVDHRPASVTALKRRATLERKLLDAEELFSHALGLEESDIDAARAGYIAALESHGDHLEARINLGRLMHLNGELEAAEKIYREAKHASALLSFNLANLLEDLNREEEAADAYREALALDPSFHDAHYNLSRIHERAERPREALRHLLAYRRHTTEPED